MNIAITGATGNMGQAVVAALRDADCIDKIKILSHNKKRTRKLLKANKSLNSKIELIEGAIFDKRACDRLIDGCDVVIHLAAVIPPRSDQNPRAAVECNEYGTYALVDAIERAEKQPILIHTSSVALYGNRDYPHRLGRVGDPLLISPLDVYSVTKLRSEFRVLESKIETWAVLRQTAMLHKNMLSDNIHDGLMFHTCFKAPLEWLTAYDSGLLIKNILLKLDAGEIPQSFWKRCYNMAGGKSNRKYGADTFNEGFGLIGGCAKQYFKPQYNATRNFHGVWYLDGDELNDLFAYQTQSVADYWNEVIKAHPVFKLAKAVPRPLVAHFAVKRLRKDKNAPAYWYEHGDDARITAHFGSRASYEQLANKTIDEVLPDENDRKIQQLDENPEPIFYGYDINKTDAEITLDDLKSVAEAHGGKLISTEFDNGDMYRTLEWETQDGERFFAKPYTVLRAGHWMNPIYKEYVWDFDRLSKKDKIFAGIWYDSHAEDENMRYGFDENFEPHAEKIS